MPEGSYTVHPRVFTSFTFVVHLWNALFPACGEREILHVACKQIEIYFTKVGFVDSKCTNLSAPDQIHTHTPLVVIQKNRINNRSRKHYQSYFGISVNLSNVADRPSMRHFGLTST